MVLEASSFSTYWCIFLQLQLNGWLPVKGTTTHIHETGMTRQMEGEIQSMLERVLTAHWRYCGS
jgi:hypothetical protein